VSRGDGASEQPRKRVLRLEEAECGIGRTVRAAHRGLEEGRHRRGVAQHGGGTPSDMPASGTASMTTRKEAGPLPDIAVAASIFWSARTPAATEITRPHPAGSRARGGRIDSMICGLTASTVMAGEQRGTSPERRSP